MAEKSARRIAAEQAAAAAKTQRVGSGPTAEQIAAHRDRLGGMDAQIAALQSKLGSINKADYQRKIREEHRRGSTRWRTEFRHDDYNRDLAAYNQRKAELDRLTKDRNTFFNNFQEDPQSKRISTRLMQSRYGKSKRERDIMSGAKFGEEVLGNGLGRLQEDVDVQETLGRFKEISEKGLSSQEVEAERTQAFQGIDRSNQTALRGIQARLAAAGVKGATAGQQLLQGAMSGAAQKANVERDLFLKSAAAKREGLKDYSSRLGEVKTFDLAQAAREKDIVLQAGLGQGQMGVAERAAEAQARAQEAAARARASAAPSCFLAGTLINMKDGTRKPIEELEVGDEAQTGTITGLSKHLRDGQKVYLYDNTFVTGKHYVLHQGEWMCIEDTGAAEAVSAAKYVYNIWTSTGTVTINATMFADYEGFAKTDIDKIILDDMNESTRRVLQRKV